MYDRMLSVGMTPLPPPVPEIEGFLKKLKRKTSNLSGSWNKRWFFVDQKRREFGYAKSKTPGAPKSSIYLNDITAVVQFDDTHFQVESRTRNFFLCGESKASTTCWVKSLDEYRKKLLEYEKEKAKYDAALAAAQSQLSLDAQAAFLPKAVATIAQLQISSHEDRLAPTGGKAHAAGVDEPSRDSSSSSLASSSSSSSTASASKRANRAHERQVGRDGERREASPAEQRPSRDREHDSSGRGRDREHDRDRDRESDRGRERERARPSESRSSTRQFENRSIAEATSVRAHPGKGYVMQAWVDDDI